MKNKLTHILGKSNDRFDISVGIINELNFTKIAELGVYRGDYAKKILENCHNVDKYTMIDPWRNLSDWNKPANKDNNTFKEFFEETMSKTDFAKDKRIILRGKTIEIIKQIEDSSLDFVYIDGDHTLKGISIDLISIWPKVKENGCIVGDDFVPSIWQHSKEYEPTMVFPFAVYFAEAVQSKIFGLPFGQFVIFKTISDKFEFINLTGRDYNLELRKQFYKKKLNIKKLIKKLF